MIQTKKLISIILAILMIATSISAVPVFATEFEETNQGEALTEESLGTPQNLTWKDDSTATASWDAVEGANYYDVNVYVYDEDEKTCLGKALTGTDITEVDVQQEINHIYNSANSSSSYVYIQFSVVSKYIVNDNIISESTCSQRTSLIKYIINNTYQFETPKNVALSEDLIATWDCPEKWEKITGFNIKYNMHLKGETGEYNQLCCVFKSSVSSSGKAQVDLSNDIMKRYIDRGYTNEEVEISIAVNMYVLSSDIDDDVTYINSDFSLPSNTIAYIPRKAVENIKLSPGMPIIALDNSYFLGKTVYPEDAYYSSIDWVSSNPDIVSVDSNGKITGVSVGSADITATIGSISQNVTVTVYEIESNIEDENDKDKVTDTAGGIIDDIANNDNPDLSDTDIDKDDLDDVKQDIQDGIENGDSFHTDIKAIQTYFDAYKENWGQIQKAARELNAQFAGAYNIEVEMYHKDKDDVEHHIGNITELDNEISFTFDLPTGMKEMESGGAKKYVLVRVHKNSDGEMECSPVDFTVNDDGTFTAQSNQYSDFVFLVLEDEHDCNTSGHVEVIDLAVAPTCTTTGLTEGKHCSVCGEILVAQTAIDAFGHSFTYYVSNGDATCTADGTKTAKCDRCDVTDTLTDEGSAKGHTIVIDKAVTTTCTETGLTEGSHCSVCNTVLVKQEVIPATGHNDSNSDGICDNCGENLGTHTPSENCTCICHKGGFMGFIYKIIRIFWKIFGTNKACACGQIHY